MKETYGLIALLGTSADPPTLGHQALLEGLLKIFPKVITWASDNPLKTHSAPLEIRYELLNALVSSIANPQLEIIQDLSSPWSITTLEKAANRWPNNEFIFVVGSDLAWQIPSWAKSKNLLQKVRIGIAPREGWPIKDEHLHSLKALGGQVDILPLKIPASASSEARNNFAASQIPPDILPLVLEKNLYGLSRYKK